MPVKTTPSVCSRRCPASASWTDSLLGVVISHPHQDHYGLARHIRPGVPIFIGEAANGILKAAAPYVPDGHWFSDARFYRDREPFAVGPFTITPYLVDHSAFDAYALLIEADGRRLYYSGDFPRPRPQGRARRAHLARTTERNRRLDDGGNDHRAGAQRGRSGNRGRSRGEVRRGVRRNRRAALRLDFVSEHRSRRHCLQGAQRARRRLLIDLYTAVVLEATGKRTIPQSHWENVGLYVPFRQRLHVKEHKLFDDLRGHSANRVYPRLCRGTGSGP